MATIDPWALEKIKKETEKNPVFTNPVPMCFSPIHTPQDWSGVKYKTTKNSVTFNHVPPKTMDDLNKHINQAVYINDYGEIVFEPVYSSQQEPMGFFLGYDKATGVATYSLNIVNKTSMDSVTGEPMPKSNTYAYPMNEEVYSDMGVENEPEITTKEDEKNLPYVKKNGFKEFKEATSITNFIVEKFKTLVPWMSLITLYKFNNKQIAVNYVMSLPNLGFKLGIGKDEHSLNLFSNWQQKREDLEEDPNQELLGIDDDIAKSWTKVKSQNFYSPYTSVPPIPDSVVNSKTFKAVFEMRLDLLRRIDVYEWGFIIQTDAPMGLVAILNDELVTAGDVNGKSSNMKASKFLADSVGEEFTLPNNAADLERLIATWTRKDDQLSAEAEAMDAFMNTTSMLGEKSMDVGQRNYDNLEI